MLEAVRIFIFAIFYAVALYEGVVSLVTRNSPLFSFPKMWAGFNQYATRIRQSTPNTLAFIAFMLKIQLSLAV